MGFESVMEADLRKRGFGSQRYLACGKERPHISKAKVAAHDDSHQVKTGDSVLVRYSGWADRRYLAFENLSYDFIVALYDVNSREAFAIRLFDSKQLMKKLKAGLGTMMKGRPNLEARVMGLQNKEDHAFLGNLLSFLSNEGIRLIEADLFGEEVRHIAIDLKTGTSFNMLLDDRHYRPGELINSMTIDDFSRTIMQSKK